ncbi:hypothetical protein N8D56_07725 [Devosia sp. A8/3-2]|nr:hypothetical protein N8D56_07725 [Devosia sp. A8/3-2]
MPASVTESAGDSFGRATGIDQQHWRALVQRGGRVLRGQDLRLAMAGRSGAFIGRGKQHAGDRDAQIGQFVGRGGIANRCGAGFGDIASTIGGLGLGLGGAAGIAGAHLDIGDHEGQCSIRS